MDPIQEQQMQMAQGQGGLGTPPPPPFEYKENPSTALMNAHVGDQLQKRAESKEQEALKARAEADASNGGYAGYKSEPSANVGQQNGWAASSPEVHNMNLQLADRIKSGQLDMSTAMIALQSNDVAPEIKQVLSQMVQKAQASQQMEMPSEQAMQGQQVANAGGLGELPQQLPQ